MIYDLRFTICLRWRARSTLSFAKDAIKFYENVCIRGGNTHIFAGYIRMFVGYIRMFAGYTRILAGYIHMVHGYTRILAGYIHIFLKHALIVLTNQRFVGDKLRLLGEHDGIFGSYGSLA
jgi:hypothetical protein